MGFFSFHTCDTDRSIPNIYQKAYATFPVHLITEDGRIFTESEYDGYGEFGGKDFFILAAELNGINDADDNVKRNRFFDECWLRGIEKDGVRLYYRKDFSHYQEPLQHHKNLNANELVKKEGWEYFDYGGEDGLSCAESFVKNGLKMPKIVEFLPSGDVIGDKQKWVEFWAKLPYPKDCRYQGYFYEEDDDEDIDW